VIYRDISCYIVDDLRLEPTHRRHSIDAFFAQPRGLTRAVDAAIGGTKETNKCAVHGGWTEELKAAFLSSPDVTSLMLGSLLEVGDQLQGSLVEARKRTCPLCSKFAYLAKSTPPIMLSLSML